VYVGELSSVTGDPEASLSEAPRPTMRGTPIQLLLIGDREKVDSRQAITGSPETRLEDSLCIGMVRPVGHYQRLCIEIRMLPSDARFGLTKECYQVRVLEQGPSAEADLHVSRARVGGAS